MTQMMMADGVPENEGFRHQASLARRRRESKYEQMKWSTMTGKKAKCHEKYKINVNYHCA